MTFRASVVSAALAWALLAAVTTARAATLTSVTVNNYTVAHGSTPATHQFTATAHYSDNSTRDVTGSATWSSSNTAVATVSNSGGTSGLASMSGPVGYSEIAATYSGFTGGAGLTVTTSFYAPYMINPSVTDGTGAGINSESVSKNYHYVVLPRAQLKNVLVIFLGGSLSMPSDYEQQTVNGVTYASLPTEAASMGFAAIDLRYLNGNAVGSLCGHAGVAADSCYTQYRGEVLFGDGVTYAGGPYDYDSLFETPVDQANSVVNRIVNLLDCLANDAVHCPNDGSSAYWSQFLSSNPNAPYRSASYPTGGVEPNWSRIVIAGHSQGGGQAAFLGVKSASALRRVVMFSSPEDYYTPLLGSNTSASWITTQSLATPMSHFWGMRNTNEGAYGDFESTNWGHFKDSGNTGVGNPSHSAEAAVGDGSVGAVPVAAQRLLTTNPDVTDTLYGHESTANTVPAATTMNGTPFSNGRTWAWDYVLTGNGSD